MNPEIKILDQVLRDCTAQSIWCADENTSGFSPPLFRGNIISNRIDIVDQLQPIYPDTIFSDFDFSNFDLTAIDSVVLRIAKEKAINLHIISEAFKHLKKNGKLILIGYKNEGIKSLCSKIQSSYECRISIKKYKSQLHLVEIETPYAQSEVLSEAQYSELQKLCINNTEFYTKPGVYGWNKIDRGSELLIEALSKNKQAIDTLEVLDLGCGYGYLSIKAKELGFQRIDATDNNAAAIHSCLSNFQMYSMSGEVFADDHAKHREKKYDLVLCNPPFHKGFGHTKSLTEIFTQQASSLLKPNGEAYIVTNQFIGIEKIADKLFSASVLLLKQEGFKVFVFKK